LTARTIRCPRNAALLSNFAEVGRKNKNGTFGTRSTCRVYFRRDPLQPRYSSGPEGASMAVNSVDNPLAVDEDTSRGSSAHIVLVALLTAPIRTKELGSGQA
jgi:hypothetical protein